MATLPIELSQAAEADLADAYDWYHRIEPGLSEAFLLDFLATAAHIHDNPQQYACIHGEVRHALLRRFPYVVYYRIRPDRVRIIAVPHGHRRPRQWQARN